MDIIFFTQSHFVKCDNQCSLWLCKTNVEKVMGSHAIASGNHLYLLSLQSGWPTKPKLTCFIAVSDIVLLEFMATFIQDQAVNHVNTHIICGHGQGSMSPTHNI